MVRAFGVSITVPSLHRSDHLDAIQTRPRSISHGMLRVPFAELTVCHARLTGRLTALRITTKEHHLHKCGQYGDTQELACEEHEAYRFTGAIGMEDESYVGPRSFARTLRVMLLLCY